MYGYTSWPPFTDLPLAPLARLAWATGRDWRCCPSTSSDRLPRGASSAGSSGSPCSSPAVSRRTEGRAATVKRAQSIEFADYRHYAAGDDLRQLDWTSRAA